MKNKLLHSFRLRATMLVAMMLCVVNATWADEVTYMLTIDASDFNTTSYAANNNEKTSNAVCTTDGSKTYEVKWTSYQVMKSGSNMQWQKSKGYIYNSTDLGTITSVTVNSSAGSFTTYYGTTEQPTSGTTVGNGYFKTNVGGATGTTSSIVINFTISTSGSSLTDNDLTLNASEKSFDLADGANQTFQLTNSGSADGALSYASNDVNVATVSNTGLITAVGEGTATITVTQAASSTYKGGSATCTVTVSDSRYTVSNLTFTAACGGAGTADDGAAWTVESDGTESVYDGTSGIHYGTGSASVTYLQLSTSDINGQVSRVVVNARDAQAKATISVTVGGVAFTCTGSATATNTSTDYTFTGTGTGEIVVRIDRGSSMSKAIYVKSVKVSYVESNDPSISASDVNIDYDATEGSISYTINNPVQDGVVSVDFDSEGDWLLTATDNNGTISFTCEANENTTERQALVVITYTYNTNETVTKSVWVTQAAAPVVYSTIPTLFAAATGTETEVKVTFNNWVVSGVSTNGKNVFVTDNNGNGFVIFDNNGGLNNTYSVGSVLSGTAVTCNLVLYNGFAEIKNLDASNLTITTGGTVTAANVAMADLAGVNTGALVSYENLTCSVDNNKYYLSDGTTTLQVYNALFAFDALEAGKTYNITGIYQQYNSTKELMPRSAADIVEVVSSEPSITVATTTVNVAATDDNGTIGITYANLSINDMNDFGIQYCDAQGNELSQGSEPTWIDVLVAEDNSDYVVSYTMDENTSTDARSAYFKVFAMGDADFVYSDLITVTQAGVVVDYATLPFEFDGGKSAIESTNGLTQEGLGNDYSDPNALLKFDSTGDHVILKINERPGTLSFNIKNNSFSGGTFKVQTSDDGETYQDLKSYTEINGTQNESINLDENVRYIKWIYTEKVNGNVGIGIIKVTSTESVTVTSAGYAAIVTKNNVSFYNSEVTAYIVTATATDQATLTEVEEAPAGTPLIVKAAAGTYNLTVINDATNVSGNLLQASNGTVKGDGSTIFALGNKDGVGFYVVANGVTVPAGKPYLVIGSGNGVKGFLAFNFGTPTAISNLEAQKAERGTLYNLAGQRVNKAVKGIFIQNGKKIVVK